MVLHVQFMHVFYVQQSPLPSLPPSLPPALPQGKVDRPNPRGFLPCRWPRRAGAGADTTPEDAGKASAKGGDDVRPSAGGFVALSPRSAVSAAGEKKYMVLCKYAFFLFGVLFNGGRVFFKQFRLRGKQGGLRYITTHIGIPAELRGGALNIQRR